MLVRVREIPEGLLTSVTTKIGVTKSVTQRIVAHSRVITRAVTQSSSLNKFRRTLSSLNSEFFFTLSLLSYNCGRENRGRVSLSRTLPFVNTLAEKSLKNPGATAADKVRAS